MYHVKTWAISHCSAVDRWNIMSDKACRSIHGNARPVKMLPNKPSIPSNSYGSTFFTQYSADGGLNKVFLGVGASFLDDRLNAGVNLSYAFGITNYTWINDFVNSSFATVTTRRRILLSGLVPRVGVQYTDHLKYSRKENQIEKLIKEEETLKDQAAQWKAEEESLLKTSKKIDAKAPAVEAKQAELQRNG